MQDVPETFVILNIGDILNIWRLFAIKRASRYTPTHANRRNEEKKKKSYNQLTTPQKQKTKRIRKNQVYIYVIQL